MAIDNQIKKQMFFSMLRIRMAEEKIDSLYMQDNMKTPVHLCIGQEAIAVGVCQNLIATDFISSNHRGHGHYLAKGGDLNTFIAELHCKATGCSKGFGGSMHLVDTSVGIYGSSAIVAGGVSIATGVGLACKMKKTKQVSVTFFGDGAIDQGAFYESVNFAMLKKLPVIYVYENNDWSVCSRVVSRHATDNVFHHTDPSLLWTKKIDGNDVALVYQTMKDAVQRARQGDGPSFIECSTYRMLGHSGCKQQDSSKYRDTEEIEQWLEKCPISRFKKHLETYNLLSDDEFLSMKDNINNEIDVAFKFASDSPLPSSTEEDLYTYIYSE